MKRIHHLGPTMPKAPAVGDLAAVGGWHLLPGSVEFKAVGQVVYRYESATSSESKEMVAQAHPETNSFV